MITDAKFSRRLVLVTPRYWPLAGEIEFTTGELAAGLRELGAQVTVLTGSWGSNWPGSMTLHGVRVVRVPHAPRGGWNAFRYLTAVNRWLRSHRAEFDAVYVMGLRIEAYAVVSALRRFHVPTVLHGHDFGPAGDCLWQTHSRWGARVKHYCQQAQAVVVPNSLVKQELLDLGYHPRRLHEIPLGVSRGESRSTPARVRARAILAETNRDLAAAEYAPVALFGGLLDEADGILRVVKAWRFVADRWPTARLWIVGEGPARDEIGERLIDWDLRAQVVLPGAFEDWSDLLHAADLFIWPDAYGGRQTILKAMAAGLPVVAGESQDLRGMIEHGQHGLLVPGDSPKAWSAAMGQLLEAPQVAAQLGAAASKLVSARFPRRTMAEKHVELLERLLSR